MCGRELRFFSFSFSVLPLAESYGSRLATQLLHVFKVCYARNGRTEAVEVGRLLSQVGGRREVYDVDNEAFLVLQLVRRMWDYMRAPDIRAFGGDNCRKAYEVWS